MDVSGSSSGFTLYKLLYTFLTDTKRSEYKKVFGSVHLKMLKSMFHVMIEEKLLSPSSDLGPGEQTPPPTMSYLTLLVFQHLNIKHSCV